MVETVSLTKKVEELESTMKELVKNQQPSVVNNMTNVNINFFLNTVCKNACSIEEFINKID